MLMFWLRRKSGSQNSHRFGLKMGTMGLSIGGQGRYRHRHYVWRHGAGEGVNGDGGVKAVLRGFVA